MKKKKQTITDFMKKFGTEEACRKHLFKLKWEDDYCCLKCGYNVHVKGRTWYYRKCQKIPL